MAVDQQLLNRGGGQSSTGSGEDAMASRLMQDKNKAKAAAGPSDSEEPKMDFSQYSPMAQMGSIVRRQNATKSSGTGKTDPASSKSVMAKINDFTAKILKTAWQNIIFYSFTSSIIYVDIHVLGGMIFPKMFCKLGHEWIPKEMKQAAPKQAEAFGDQLGSCEKGCCCCVNGFCGIITISVLAITAFVVGIVESTIGKFFGWIAGLFNS